MKTYTYERAFEVAFGEGEAVKLPILVTKKSGCCIQTLEATFGQFVAMMSHYDKLTLIRSDLHMEQYSGNSEYLSDFIEYFKDRLQSDYAKKVKAKNKERRKQGKPILSENLGKVAVMWCRELVKAEQQHYHVFLLVDGSKIQSSWNVSKIIENMINSISRSHIFASPSRSDTTKTIKRGDLASLQDAFKWVSYIAKERSKGCRDKSANDYSTSRIKPNTDKIHLVMPQLYRPPFKLIPPNDATSKKKPKTKTKIVRQEASNHAIQLDLFALVA